MQPPHRYAGRAFEAASQVEEGKGVMQIKGVRAIWRQSAPIVQSTLQGVLERVLMHDDVPGAIELAERQVGGGSCLTCCFAFAVLVLGQYEV